MTLTQELEQYLLNTGVEDISNDFFEKMKLFFIELRQKEKLMVNKAFNEGIAYSLKAVMGHNLEPINYYEENYGK